MPTTKHHLGTTVAASIGGIVLAVNAMYFLNILPPLPLSLKESGVYHSVMRTVDGVYYGTSEERLWYAFLVPRKTVHTVRGGTLYFFSSVFAPTRLAETRVRHHWQYFDEKKDAWITRSRVEFSIAGGRDGGYRGYSLKSNLEFGLWRVRVETPRGQVLGQQTFYVEETSVVPFVEEYVL